MPWSIPLLPRHHGYAFCNTTRLEACAPTDVVEEAGWNPVDLGRRRQKRGEMAKSVVARRKHKPKLPQSYPLQTTQPRHIISTRAESKSRKKSRKSRKRRAASEEPQVTVFARKSRK